jgi:hypothetical protein
VKVQLADRIDAELRDIGVVAPIIGLLRDLDADYLEREREVITRSPKVTRRASMTGCRRSATCRAPRGTG